MDTFSSPSCYFLRFLFKAEIICKTRSNESQKNMALGLNERFIFTASTMWKTRRTKISYGPFKIKSVSVQFSSCFTHQNCCCVPSIKKNCRCSLSLALDHLSWPLFLQLLLAVELLFLLRFSPPPQTNTWCFGDLIVICPFKLQCAHLFMEEDSVVAICSLTPCI